MADSFWLLAAATLCSLMGMARFALAMPVHWQQVHGKAALAPRTALALRIGGGGALAAALFLCLAADHASMAALVWVMLLTVAAVSVAMLLAYRPRWVRFLGAWTAPAPRAN